MIRFLDLTNQIWEPEEVKDQFEFAWYSTSGGNILPFNDETVWTCWEDFEDDYISELKSIGYEYNPKDLDRYKNLFPEPKL